MKTIKVYFFRPIRLSRRSDQLDRADSADSVDRADSADRVAYSSKISSLLRFYNFFGLSCFCLFIVFTCFAFGTTYFFRFTAILKKIFHYNFMLYFFYLFFIFSGLKESYILLIMNNEFPICRI